MYDTIPIEFTACCLTFAKYLYFEFNKKVDSIMKAKLENNNMLKRMHREIFVTMRSLNKEKYLKI